MKLKHYECDNCQSVFDIHADPNDNPLEISFCVYCASPLDKDETYEVEE
jgi:predicted nucleic acid-binding Zn ribbon protein